MTNPRRTLARSGPSALWLLPILLVALALGLHGSDYALWYDEIASTRFAAEPFHRLWSDWMVNETNPPLYYSLLKLWLGLVGDSDVRIRLLSTLLGLGGIVCAWAAGRTIAGERCGLVAALLVAISQQHVFYGQMARGYGLGHSATLLALAGLTALARPTATRRQQGGALVAYAAGATLAVYSHTTLVLVPLLANLWVAARFGLEGWRRRRLPELLPGWILANLAVLALWSWWARISWLQASGMGNNIGWIQRPSLPYAVRMTLESYVPWGIGPAGLVAGALFAGLFGWGLWRSGRREWAGGLDLVALLAIGAPVLLFAISLARPIFLPRTVYFAAGPFLIGVAVGLTALPSRSFRWALAAVLVLEAGAYVAWFRQREIEPWRAVASAVSAPGAPATLVVKGVGPAFALNRYCARAGCGRQLVVVASPAVDHWAEGMARPVASSQGALAHLLDCGRPLALLRWNADDTATALPAATGRVDGVRTWGPGGSLGLARWQGPRRAGARCPAR